MQGRIHYALLAVAALFAVGLIANTIDGDAHPGDTPAQLAIIAACVGAFAFVHVGIRHRRELFEFLASNRDAIRAGTATYRGHEVTYATRVHTPYVVLGFLVVSFKLPLRPVLSQEPATGLRLGACLTCLVFGWWGFRAFMWNLGALANNIQRTPTISVGELIEGRAVSTVPTARAS
jgi:hypothetical protein